MSISMPYPDGTRMVRFTDKTWLLLTKNTWQALNSPDGKEIIDIYDPGSNGSREIFFSDKTY